MRKVCPCPFRRKVKDGAVPDAGADAVLRSGGGLRGAALLQYLYSRGGADHYRESPTLPPGCPGCFSGPSASHFDRLPEEERAGKLIFQITDRSKLDRIINQLGLRSPAEPGPPHQLRPCWRRSAAGRPSCGGPFWRAAASPTRKSATIWSWPPRHAQASRELARPADGDGLSAPQRAAGVAAP